MLHSLTIRCIYPQPGGTYTYIYKDINIFFSKHPQRYRFLFLNFFWFACHLNPPPLLPTMRPRLLPLDRDQGPRFHWKGHRYTVHEFTESRWMSLGVRFLGGSFKKGGVGVGIWIPKLVLAISGSRSSSLGVFWLGMATVGYDGVNDITYFGRNYQRVVICMVVFECALQGA